MTAGSPDPPPPQDVSPAMHAFTADGPTGLPTPMTAPRPPAPTDGVLVARPASDFDTDFATLFDTLFDTLFAAQYERLVRALTLVAGDAEAAADAVQEAFVKAHLRWRTIGSHDDPIGWMRRVAINQIRDGHRRRVRKDRALLRGSPAVRRSPPRRSRSTSRPLLAELPKQQRAATALYYVDGLSVAEIATALGIAEGSVKSHLHDARRRLRPVLEREAAGRGGRPGTPVHPPHRRSIAGTTMSNDHDPFDPDLAAALRGRVRGPAPVSVDAAHDAVLRRSSGVRRLRAAVAGGGLLAAAVIGIALIPRGDDGSGGSDRVAPADSPGVEISGDDAGSSSISSHSSTSSSTSVGPTTVDLSVPTVPTATSPSSSAPAPPDSTVPVAPGAITVPRGAGSTTSTTVDHRRRPHPVAVHPHVPVGWWVDHGDVPRHAPVARLCRRRRRARGGDRGRQC